MATFVLRSLDHHSFPVPSDVSDGVAVLDLSGISFVVPVSIVILASRMSLLRQNGIEVQIIAPRNPDVANYLSRMGLLELCEQLGGIQCSVPLVRSSPQASRLLEVTPFQKPEDLDELALQVSDHMPAGTSEATQSLLTCIYEVGQNVPQHAQSQYGFAAAQYYPRKGSYLFAIGDSGLGLRATLGSKYAPQDDTDAIRLAVAEGVSRKNGNRGKGLHTTRRILTGQAGSLTVISGKTSVTYSDPESEPREFKSGRGGPGTLISGMLPSSMYD